MEDKIGVFICTGYGIAEAGAVVNGQTAGILLVLVFGAGTDYALLLVSRYREELRQHRDRHEAMAVALRRSGPAILASAGTGKTYQLTNQLLRLLFREVEPERIASYSAGDGHDPQQELDELVASSDTGGRTPPGAIGKLILVVALAWSLFQLWIASMMRG